MLSKTYFIIFLFLLQPCAESPKLTSSQMADAHFIAGTSWSDDDERPSTSSTSSSIVTEEVNGSSWSDDDECLRILSTASSILTEELNETSWSDDDECDYERPSTLSIQSSIISEEVNASALIYLPLSYLIPFFQKRWF